MVRRNRQYDVFRELYGKEVRAQIKKILEGERGLTVQAVATRMKVSYQTAQRRLLELVAKGEIISRRIDEKTKIFFLNPDYKSQSEIEK